MRRILLIALGMIFGVTGLSALYVMWNYDPDDTSPPVEGTSYDGMFRIAVRERAGAEYDALSEERRVGVLGDLLRATAPDPVREVALFRAGSLADKEGALRILRDGFEKLPPALYEVAATSIGALGTPSAQGFLDSAWRKLEADPASHIPLGGYRPGSIRLTPADADLTARFEERSRTDADYTFSKGSEITFFFPADPEYFLSIPNADDMIEKFKDSRFAVMLEPTPVPEDAWALPVLRTIRNLRERLTTNLGFMGEYFSPEKLFRDNLSIGRYDDHYLLVSFKDKNVEVARTLVGIFETLGTDFGIRRWEIEGTEISSVASRKSGSTLSYAVVDDYFIVATDTALISRSVRTFAARRSESLGSDPLFARDYLTVDQSGNREAAFVWWDPTRYFDMIGADRQASRRRAILARVLNRPVNTDRGTDGNVGRIADVPGIFGTFNATGEDPALLWRYAVDVRSVGRNAIDSLALLAKIDMSRQIVPYLAPGASVGYGGVNYLREEYGYSNTSFDILFGFPLKSPPARYDSTLKVLFSGITSLVYTAEPIGLAGDRLWIATDTSTNDETLREQKLQPSFAVLENRVLLVASTPSLLRQAVETFTTGTAPRPGSGYLNGSLRVDSLAGNATKYLRSYLARGNRYSHREISDRIDPLNRALGLYNAIEWKFEEVNGLRRGELLLRSKNPG